MMLAIYGPTVTGKTKLALNIAKKFNSAIISADSRQVYKNLDIGTGKVSFDSEVEKHNNFWTVNSINIYGFDTRNAGEKYSSADFIKDTNKFVKVIKKRKKRSIIVGGTGYYIKSYISPPQSIGIPTNRKLRSTLKSLSVDDLYKKLLELNPVRASQMNLSDKKNPRRLIRAIEITNYGNSNIENYKEKNIKLIGLTASNEYLFKKADLWLKERLRKGLIDEVSGLINSGINTSWLINLGLEYKWITKFILGQISKSNSISRLKGDIHSLIRRQKTFFNQFSEIEIYNIEDNSWQNKLDKMLLLWYTQKNND